MEKYSVALKYLLENMEFRNSPRIFRKSPHFSVLSSLLRSEFSKKTGLEFCHPELQNFENSKNTGGFYLFSKDNWFYAAVGSFSRKILFFLPTEAYIFTYSISKTDLCFSLVLFLENALRFQISINPLETAVEKFSESRWVASTVPEELRGTEWGNFYTKSREKFLVYSIMNKYCFFFPEDFPELLSGFFEKFPFLTRRHALAETCF